MELRLSKLFTLLNSKLSRIFNYVPGSDREQGLPIMTARNDELQIDDTFLKLEATMKASAEVKEREYVPSS